MLGEHKVSRRVQRVPRQEPLNALETGLGVVRNERGLSAQGREVGPRADERY